MKSFTHRIYLVDDDAEDRLLFADALTMLNQPVVLTELTDGAELIEILANPIASKPDVIFLDLNMPRMSGYDCLESITRSPEFQDVRIVVLSTSSNYETVFNAYAAGADFFAIKPSDFGSYPKLIQKALDARWTLENPRSKATFLLNPEMAYVATPHL